MCFIAVQNFKKFDEFKPFKMLCERIFFSIRIVFLKKNVPILIKCPLGAVCKLGKYINYT